MTCARSLLLLLLLVPSMCTTQNANVAIIGAGFAGLSAFQHLQDAGITADLFEASDRLGGRVFPLKFEDGYLQLGAEFVESVGNPIFDIAKKLNLISDTSPDSSIEDIFDSTVFKTGTCKLDKDLTEDFKKFAQRVEDDIEKLAEHENNWKETIGSFYKKRFNTYVQKKNRSAKELDQLEALSKFYMNYYEVEWSGPANKTSLRNFDAWEFTATIESITTLNKFGYQAILDELTKNIPQTSVHLSSKVTLIDYSGDKIRLKINDDKFHPIVYDYVIVTVSLGYLKAHANELFNPKLPADKMEVITSLGFGSLIKIFLVYEKRFWEEDGYNTVFVPLQLKGCSSESKIAPALLSIDAVHWKPNVLTVWTAGDSAKLVDDLSDTDLAQQVTDYFKSTMPGSAVTAPSKIIRKSWIKDDNVLGSYSYITPESVKFDDPFKLLARPLPNANHPKVLFAGEATDSKIFQTTIGAYLSGQREANRLLKSIKTSKK